MSSGRIYYVYVYLDPETREPFYVGKGKGERAYSHLKDATDSSNTLPKHNKIRRLKRRLLSPIILIPYNNISEQEAFQKESSLIAHYGRKDMGTGCLYNMSDGGEGNSGHRYCRDSTVHKLTNIYTKEVIFKTQLEMREELGMHRSSICDLIKGRKSHSHEWYLGDIPKDFIHNRQDPYKIHSLVNITTKETIKGTISELQDKSGLSGKEISSLINGKRNSVRKWTYETIEGKSFKSHGEVYTITNIIT